MSRGGRQPFNDFLQDSPGRGNRGGRGGSRGGGDAGGRGMSRGRGRGRGGSFTNDYTNVGGPVNYDIINTERYKKMDGGFNPSPYTPNTPKYSGDSTPRSGSATPSLGLGFGVSGPSTNQGSSTPIRGRGNLSSSRNNNSNNNHNHPSFNSRNDDTSITSPYAGMGRGRGGGAFRQMYGRGRGFGSGSGMIDGSERGAPIFVKGTTAFLTMDDQPDVVPVAKAVEEEDEQGEEEKKDENQGVMIEESADEGDPEAMDTVEDILLVGQVSSMNISPQVPSFSIDDTNLSESITTIVESEQIVATDQEISIQETLDVAEEDWGARPTRGVGARARRAASAQTSGVSGREDPKDLTQPTSATSHGAELPTSMEAMEGIIEMPAAEDLEKEVHSDVAEEMADGNEDESQYLEMPSGLQVTTGEEPPWSGNTDVGFFMDTSAAPGDQPQKRILFESTTIGILGEQDDEDEEEEEMVFIPQGNGRASSSKSDPVDKPAPTKYDLAVASIWSGIQPKGKGKEFTKPIAVVSQPSNGRKQDKKTKKAQKKAGRQAKRDGRSRKTEGKPRIGDSDLDWGSGGPSGTPDESDMDHRAVMKKYHQDLIAGRDEEESTKTGSDPIDLTENTDGESDAQDISVDALKRFVKGISGQQVMIHDIELERQIKLENEQDEEDWQDESDSEPEQRGGLGHKNAAEDSSDGDEEEEEAIDKTAGIKEDDTQLSEAYVTDSEDSDDDEESDHPWRAKKDDRPWRHVALGDKSESEEEDSDDDEDASGIFGESKRGKETWGEAADDYIEHIQKVVDENAAMLQGGKVSRAERKKLFKSIENGDFGEDWGAGPVPKGKKAKKAGIPLELQDQWEKDRQKKAEFKRERQLERLEAEFNLFPGAKVRFSTKDKGKKKANRWEPTGWSDDGEEDWGAKPQRGGKKGLNPVTNLKELNEQIRNFLMDEGKTTMSLPPMDKGSRKRVHELAGCYNLKSQSKGSGKSRFPILIRSSRSSIQAASKGKIEHILSLSTVYEFRGSKDKRSGPSARLPGAAGRSGAGGKDVRHKDGDIVGGQASAIGSDNIGHRLLSRMGWSEGGQIGLSAGGLNAPIAAVVKNSKLGLGA